MGFSNLLDVSSFFIGVLINLLLIAMICFYFKRKIDNLELSQSEQAKMLFQIIQNKSSSSTPTRAATSHVDIGDHLPPKQDLISGLNLDDLDSDDENDVVGEIETSFIDVVKDDNETLESDTEAGDVDDDDEASNSDNDDNDSESNEKESVSDALHQEPEIKKIEINDELGEQEPEIKKIEINDELGEQEPEIKKIEINDELGEQEPEIKKIEINDELGEQEPEIKKIEINDELGEQEPEVEAEFQIKKVDGDDTVIITQESGMLNGEIEPIKVESDLILNDEEGDILTETEGNINYEKYTIKELKHILESNGVQVQKKNMKKQELISMIMNTSETTSTVPQSIETVESIEIPENDEIN